MDIKLNAFVQQVKTDLATGKISKQDHDNALRNKGVDPETYQMQGDSADLTGLKEAGSKLSSSAAGASKAEKKTPDQAKAPEAPQAAPKKENASSTTFGITLGIDDNGPTTTRKSSGKGVGAFGPSSEEALTGLTRHSQGSGGMLQGATGGAHAGVSAPGGTRETRAAARARLASMQSEWNSLTAGIGIDVTKLNG